MPDAPPPPLALFFRSASIPLIRTSFVPRAVVVRWDGHVSQLVFSLRRVHVWLTTRAVWVSGFEGRMRWNFSAFSLRTFKDCWLFYRIVILTDRDVEVEAIPQVMGRLRF